MTYETLLVDKQDFVTTVTLNRPDRLNALNMQLADELHDVLVEEDRNDETRVIVLTGAGRAFSAGADLRPSDTDSGPASATAPTLAERLFQALIDVEKPIIASINGVAVGGGCTMTLLCDIRIASENARFQLPFTKLGICAELGSTHVLPRLIGLGKAQELILTSKMVEAEEALQIGLVNHVVPADQLEQATLEMANNIAKLPPMAVRMNKRGLKLGAISDIESQVRYENLTISMLRTTEDAQEAMRAFREKRDPVFTGR
ncbi:MAG: enoyl-CoA hydratase-related protein [Gammaproteobacteria bacterium]|nr:enoyl-CoA hydratase-related protein [Gammaproteobacteria bacterium]